MTHVKRDRTRLQIVNEILRKAGVSQVSTLGTSLASDQVEELLDSNVRDFSGQDWDFNNTENLLLTPAANGWLFVPDDVLSVNVAGKEYSIRGGRVWDDENDDYLGAGDDGSANLFSLPYRVDLSGGWTTTGSSTTAKQQDTPAPDGTTSGTATTDPNGVWQVVSTGVDPSPLAESFPDTSFVDETDYEISFFVGPQSDYDTSVNTTFFSESRLVYGISSGAADAQAAKLLFQADRPEAAGNIAIGNGAKNPQMYRLPYEEDKLGSVDKDGEKQPWVYCSYQFEYDSARSASSNLILTLDGCDTTTTGFSFNIWGISVRAAGSVKVNATLDLDIRELPPLAQDYMIERTVYDFYTLQGGTRHRLEKYQQKMHMAFATFTNDYCRQHKVSDFNNFSVRRSILPGYQNPLRNRNW
jgi:hypothetical protein